MVLSISVLVLAVAIFAWRVVLRRLRQRAAGSMIVPTYPGIELDQRYGAWDADAYDAHVGRTRSIMKVQLPGPPSKWGWPP